MAENEVAHAGIGVDVGVNGLDKLIKTNSFMEKLRQNAEKIHNITSNITTHVENESEVQHLKNQLDQLRHDYKVNLDVDSNGAERTKSVINSIESSTHRLQDSLKSVGNDSSSSFNKFDDSASKAREKSSSLTSEGKKIHGIFSGTFIGNTASQAFSSITSGAKSAITSGIKLVSVGRDTERAWRNVGLSQNQSNAMTEQMDDIRDKAGLDEQAINMMQKSFYSLTGSAPKARSLTNELVSFGKATGESNQQIERMGKTLPRMLSTGKVSGQMFNRTFRQSPALINAIAKASGHTTGQFRQLVSSGKITSQQLQQYMMQAAKGSGNAWKEYANTFQGQLNVIRGTWTKAKENFTRPFVSNLTKTINQTTKSGGGLLKIQKVASQLSTTLGKKVGNYMGKAIGWIVKNQKPLIQTGSAIFRILKAIGSGVWKEFITILNAFTGGSQKSTKSFNSFSKALTHVASHTKQIQTLGRVLAAVFIISKINKFNKALVTMIKKLTGIKSGSKLVSVAIGSVNHQWERSGHTVARLYMNLSTLRHPLIQTKISAHNLGLAMQNVWHRSISNVKSFGHSLTWANLKQKIMKIGMVSLRSGITGLKLAQIGFKDALLATPLVGWIQIAIDGLMAIYAHSAKFRALVNPLLRGIGHMIGLIGNGIADCIEGIIKFVKWIGHLAGSVTHLFHHTQSSAASTHSSMNRYTRNSEVVYGSAQRKNIQATNNAHKSIDRYRRNSSGKFRAYIAKNGRIYKHYHAGTTRISETTYKQREALRRRYYARYESSLRKYEANYKKYESKRSSLSRRYGKLRAMYSEKSLKTIENRFKGLRNTVVRYARMMFRDTQRIFKRLGTGASRQFRNIYRSVRKYMRMSIREDTRDFKQIYRINRRYLNGSIRKYIGELRYRYKKQRFYDRQLVKQSKATAKSMYRLPLGWITRETKDLIRNWQRQRRSYITHNHRMTHAELTHLHAMSAHLDHFGDDFRKLMDDLEDNIYSKWVKFWDKMHNATGRGINAVQSPLNSGAEHINSFVRAFGETSSPMHEMPEVSYATGTGAFRRPITKMVNATLNDGHDSPETNEQETVIHPNGAVEFPQGLNTQETLEPGAEVLNATETKLMGEMAHFAPTVHFSTGTGMFGGLFNKMGGWIRSALEGSNHGTDYSTLYGQAKGSGYKKLLHVLQAVLGHSEQVLSGFMGNAPSGYNGALSDIVKGIYGQTSTQIDEWWKALMNLTNQALNNGGSSSALLNFAEKNFSGIPYSMGGESHAAADCSGAVDMIARHFGVDLPRTTTGMENDPSQLQYVGKDEGRARAGDLVLFGHGNGAAGHVGIYTGHPDEMWNETPPRSRISKISDAESVVSLAGFYRLKKLANDNNSSLSFKGANSGLMRFVKRQENPMLKWIAKHLAPLLDPNPGGSGVARWRPYIERAAQQMHVHLTQSGLDKILSNIRHESGGDPTVTQHGYVDQNTYTHPAQGLVQFIPPTFEHYAVAGHHNIKSGYDQLLALFNDSSWYSDIAPGGGWAPSGSRRMQAGGHINRGELATVGEEGEELFKPDNSGTIIPHSTTKKIMNNNSQKPITIHQDITFNGSSSNSVTFKRELQTGMAKANDNLMQKLNRLGGNDKGGLLV